MDTKIALKKLKPYTIDKTERVRRCRSVLSVAIYDTAALWPREAGAFIVIAGVERV